MTVFQPPHLISIIFPLITTIFQLHRASTNVWSKNQYNGHAIRAWLTQYSKVMYFISLLTGSAFTSIELVNTNLFSLVVLNMGLPRKDIYSFRNQRIKSSVLCENVPQLILQSGYGILTYMNYGTNFGIILIVSMSLSLISIITSIFSCFTSSNLLNTEEYIICIFDVLSTEIVRHRKRLSQNLSKFKIELSAILEFDANTMDVLKPFPIAQGLRITTRIGISQSNKTVNDINQLLMNAHKNGSFHQGISNAWNLKSIPNIKDIKCTIETNKSNNANNIELTNAINQHLTINSQSNNTSHVPLPQQNTY
mmetsp:Transcript_107493/g.131156  ORF Transcript_107493/g.131156 Transcript_107493/m.131156 type:complete len:309 (+) Transcript_107493:60-986(+)